MIESTVYSVQVNEAELMKSETMEICNNSVMYLV